MFRADYISFEVCKTLQLSILLKLFLSEETNDGLHGFDNHRPIN